MIRGLQFYCIVRIYSDLEIFFSANCHAKHVSQTSRDDSAVNNKAPLLDQKINEENQCELNKVAEEPDPTNTSVVCQVSAK